MFKNIVITRYVSFGSVRQFLFDYHHDSLKSIHPTHHLRQIHDVVEFLREPLRSKVQHVRLECRPLPEAVSGGGAALSVPQPPLARRRSGDGSVSERHRTLSRLEEEVEELGGRLRLAGRSAHKNRTTDTRTRQPDNQTHRSDNQTCRLDHRTRRSDNNTHSSHRHSHANIAE